MNSPKQNGKNTLLILLLAFILPVAVAKLVLSMDLYRGGATNNGTLIAADTTYASLAMKNPKPQQWQILYLLPKDCQQKCQNRLYILQQSHTALGKEKDRVHPVIMLDEHSDISALLPYQFITHSVNSKLAALLSEQKLIIVDPLGSLIMSYPIVLNKDAQIMQGKALIADLRKLLKLSRIG
ncbi:hypothetical protein [uncultured Shewanella sp.]|uniref:hypothetical protein n=1 Tax=uncultured Shewanella sp. TaxID=173975 RepID=UPI002637BD32|nr:hypothetical protein [uncultured Shewanella sp.]